jgi:Ca2+-transporting ATPase
MSKLIIGQAIFQFTIIMIFLQLGYKIFHLNSESAADELLLKTFIFNTFVFMQLFNEINARVLGNQLNAFKGIFHNNYFVSIWILIVAVQWTIVTFGGYAFRTTPLPISYWGISIALGSLTLPVAVMIRLLPDRWFGKEPERVFLNRERLHWQSAINDVCNTLRVFRALRRYNSPTVVRNTNDSSVVNSSVVEA